MSTKHSLKLTSMLNMLLHFVAFSYLHDSQSDEAKEWRVDLTKWVRASP